MSIVYVINKFGTPLMPTKPAYARILLKKNKARVLRTKPFTIKLSKDTSNYTQNIELGIDSGYENIGFSVVSEKEELISGEVEMLKGQKQRLEERQMHRRNRRNRKRHREPRFDNRTKCKPKGWLAPSIQHKLDTHKRLIDFIKSILPITHTVIEVANFDIQKIKDPTISGKGYQEGVQKNFWNTREHVFHRDDHKCQNPDCKNKSKEIILSVHHIVFKSNGGGDSPDNLITLCTKCHTPKNHQPGELLDTWQSKKPKLNSFKPETFMSSVRWRLKEIENTRVTFGYITKSRRIEYGIPKTHANDAFVIAGGSTHDRVEPLTIIQRRRNNRSLERFYDKRMIDVRTGERVSGKALFSGRTKRNKNTITENLRIFRGETKSKGRRAIRKQRYPHQPGDLVIRDGLVYEVVGTNSRGRNVIMKRNGKRRNSTPRKLVTYRYGKGLSVS